MKQRLEKKLDHHTWMNLFEGYNFLSYLNPALIIKHGTVFHDDIVTHMNSHSSAATSIYRSERSYTSDQ